MSEITSRDKMVVVPDVIDVKMDTEGVGLYH